jgi:hypothetical protein
MALAESAVQWGEGTYPPGTFHPLHVWIAVQFAFLLGLVHYVDKSAGTALASLRPLLVVGKKRGPQSPRNVASYASLAYQLTTLPVWPTALATVAGAVLPWVGLALLPSTAFVALLFRNAGTMLSTASIAFVLVLGNAVSGVLTYHTFHQLLLISRIYSEHTRINIYRVQPLYALSLPGALTSIGLMLTIYAAFLAAGAPAVEPFIIWLSLFFVTIAWATFALPMLGAHRRLSDEKNRRLAANSLRFEAAAEELYRQLDGRRPRRMEDPAKAMASLEVEQAALRRIPTWPWDPGAVRGLVAALLLPVAVWLLQLLLGRFLGV